jgi:RNA exonuclease 1
MLENVTTTLEDIQKKLVDILHPRTILIGHSLNSDLTALKLTHPFIIDTAVIYPHPRGPPLKSSLKWLAQKYLNREIQKGHGTTGPGAGHDSIEDAKTCLDLVKQKCEKGKEWGTNDAVGENIFKRVARKGVKYKNQGGSAIPSPLNGRTSAMIDWGDPKKGAGAAATHSIGCKSDEEVTEGVIRATNGDQDGKEIPGGGVDFVFGRLRELEALKGWWNNNKAVAQSEKAVETVAKDAAASESAKVDVQVVLQDGTMEPKAKEGADSESVAVETIEILETTAAQSAFDGAPSPLTGVSTSEALTDELRIKAEEASKLDLVETPAVEEPSTTNPLELSTEPTAPLPSAPLDSLPAKSSLPEFVTISPDTPISTATSDLVSRLQKIYDSLPPCTAFIIYSGSGDPREMSRLQAMQTQFKKEYKIKKWDQLSVKWTDTEEQALKRVVRQARNGIAFMAVK